MTSDFKMVASFTFGTHDVLCISLSLNALYFLQLASSRLVHWLLPLLAQKTSRFKTLHGLHQKWPDLFGRLLMEQFSLFVLLALVLVNLGFVSSVIPPFSHHHDYDNEEKEEEEEEEVEEVDKDNIINNYHHLTRVILSISTARFLMIAAGILQHTQRDGAPIYISSTNTRKSHVGTLLCALGITSNIIGLGYKENLFLLITLPFMELNTTSLVICRLIKLADRHRCCRSYIKTSALCCAAFLFSRVFLPLLFLCHALAQESPFVMGHVPLAWFFISGLYHMVFHSFLMYYCVRRVTKAFAFMTEAGAHSCSLHEPFSVCNYSERLVNDIYNDCDDLPGFDVWKEEHCDSEEFNFKSRPTTKLRDLNYGFLAPYDNRNLCSFVSGMEEEKINVLQKKNVSKNELMYKFMIKGDQGRSNECCCGQGGGGSACNDCCKIDLNTDVKQVNCETP